METENGTKTLTKRQKSALETRKKLLEKAREIVCQRGLCHVTVEELTAACGVAKGTFYTYFRQKEDIVYALCRETFACIRDDALASKGTFLERLQIYMEKFSKYIEQTGLKLCQEWIRNTAEPEDLTTSNGYDKLLFDLESIKALLQDGVKKGEIVPEAPIDQIAHALNGVLYGQMLSWATSNGEFVFSVQTSEYCNLFLKPTLQPWLIEKDVCK